MARILTISSQVVYGPVGNSALVPPLQAQGHEVLSLPTVLLSHHPGHGIPQALRHSGDSFENLLASVESVGGLENLDAVLTGYFAAPEQIVHTATVLQRLKKHNPKLIVLVDPVLGDHGRLYVSEALAQAIKIDLLPLATITTPNAFELSYLTNLPVTSTTEAQAAAVALNLDEVLVTSIPIENQQLGTLLESHNVSEMIQAVKHEQVPNGTGDYLSGAYLAERLQHDPQQAFYNAMKNLERVIIASLGSKVLMNV